MYAGRAALPCKTKCSSSAILLYLFLVSVVQHCVSTTMDDAVHVCTIASHRMHLGPLLARVPKLPPNFHSPIALHPQAQEASPGSACSLPRASGKRVVLRVLSNRWQMWQEEKPYSGGGGGGGRNIVAPPILCSSYQLPTRAARMLQPPLFARPLSPL